MEMGQVDFDNFRLDILECKNLTQFLEKLKCTSRQIKWLKISPSHLFGCRQKLYSLKIHDQQIPLNK